MPAPIFWLGAAAVSIYGANKLNTAHLRRESILNRLPGQCKRAVSPVNGSIVTCGIYEILDHTGIWVDGNIYELHGSGLVRCISPERFVKNRSGDDIYVACDLGGKPLANEASAKRAKAQLFSLYDYHLVKQNCHKFVATMLTGNTYDITSFSALNECISIYFKQTVDWRLTQINRR